MTNDIQQIVVAHRDLEETGAAEVTAVVRDQMKEKVSVLRDRLYRLAGSPPANDTGSDNQ